MRLHVYITLICVFSAIAPELKSENINPEQIRCIEVIGLENPIFDGYEYRRCVDFEFFSTPYIIQDSLGLSAVCQKINELLPIGSIRVSPYIESETFTIGKPGIPMISYTQMRPRTSLVFYFNDGRLPQLLLITSPINFNSRLFYDDRQWSIEMHRILKTFSKKSSDRNIIDQSLNSTIDYDAIDWVSVCLVSPSDTTKYSRDKAIDDFSRLMRQSGNKRGFFTSKEKIARIFNCLGALNHNSTLPYSVDETGYTAHYSPHGNFIWSDTSKYVIGYFVIKRKDTSYPYELIWINYDFSIDREYFEFKPNNVMTDLIMEIYNSDLEFDPI